MAIIYINIYILNTSSSHIRGGDMNKYVGLNTVNT
jgi:hypothetical protein